MPRRLVLVLICGAVVLAACGGSAAATRAAGDRVAVVTTTTQLTDLARVIGGDRVSVYGVLKANVDPHDYEPSPADLRQLGDADVLVRNGVGLEGWFEDTIASASPRGRVVDASRGVTLRTAPGQAEQDPHVWHNPQNVKIMARAMGEAFQAVDPANAATYRDNVAAYATALDELDAEVKAAIDGLANKRLVTNHDAFGYYVEHYGLEYVGAIIPSFDTQAELSVGAVEAVVAKIKATGVKAVFSESSLPAKTAEAIAREAGVKVVAGQDALYADTLGPEGSDGDTYLKMIRHNTRTIVANLG